MMGREQKPSGPSLSLLALISFIASFGIARTFTSIDPNAFLARGGVHIHHFWFGIILLAIGGWLGISYNQERIVRFAAVLYGAGGGLIGDEVGLLLKGNYWTGITYTVLVAFLAFAFTALLFVRYSKEVLAEIEAFTARRVSFYFGVILAVVSASFIPTRNFFVSTVAVLATVIACMILFAFIVQRVTSKPHQIGK